jgi:hypothetical protein
VAVAGNQLADSFDWASSVARTLHPLDVQIIEAMWWIDRPLVVGDLAQFFDDASAWAVLSRRLRLLASLGVIDLSVPAAPDITNVTYRLVQQPRP